MAEWWIGAHWSSLSCAVQCAVGCAVGSAWLCSTQLTHCTGLLSSPVLSSCPCHVGVFTSIERSADGAALKGLNTNGCAAAVLPSVARCADALARSMNWLLPEIGRRPTSGVLPRISTNVQLYSIHHSSQVRFLTAWLTDRTNSACLASEIERVSARRNLVWITHVESTPLHDDRPVSCSVARSTVLCLSTGQVPPPTTILPPLVVWH